MPIPRDSGGMVDEILCVDTSLAQPDAMDLRQPLPDGVVQSRRFSPGSVSRSAYGRVTELQPRLQTTDSQSRDFDLQPWNQTERRIVLAA